ncbi:MAG: carboxylating nicotinate-nucleotide diphosphorylase [Candidatus Nanopelagicales bacterium]|jgi:nicotinate-nucleotide pyrophosphorylase (carboxylating)|nr:carboxylating nicotinate-nucleotide diphosphorylase [Candidatus Nanopelagicales bacterium]
MTTKEQVYEDLREAGLEPELVQALVDLAISEDLMGGSDVTSLATIPETQISELDLVTRSSGVIAGIDIAALVFLSISDNKIAVEKCVTDGSAVDSKTCLLTVKGRTIDLLAAERTALNFLGHLSGIATTTNKWVKEIAGTNSQIRDTRKTTPGLRLLEKYAVKAGGGTNHRMSLNDQALIKDNHIIAAGSIKKAVEKVRDKFPEIEFEIEVDNLTQLDEALAAQAQLILLDNFTFDDLQKAVGIVNKKAKLEASGGLTLENARKIAETGVDFLAVGALTHSAPVLDIGGDLRTVR